MHYGSPAQAATAAVLLSILTLAVMWGFGIRQRLDFLGAIIRALVQLCVVALVIAWIFRHPEGAFLYIVVMIVAASATSLRRIRCGWQQVLRLLLPLTLATTVSVALTVVTGALPFAAQSLLPFTAQIIGGSMTAVTLAGTHFRDDVDQHWDEVEGFLALGATARQAVGDLGRRATGQSLIPGLDQTRSAGLVVLPGAFVGMLLGGATPAQAAQVQLLVLVTLIAAATCAATGVVWLLAPLYGSQRPSPTQPMTKH